MSNDRPESGSILLLGLPTSILCGIDLLSFTTSPKFQGIKNIPPGFHFIFTSETSSLTIRDGFWIHVPNITESLRAPLHVRKWDTTRNSLTTVEDVETHRETLSEVWQSGLSPYRQSAGKESESSPADWEGLTQHITFNLLKHLTQNAHLSLSSASTAVVDQEHIPGLDDEELGLKERELGTLGIDLKRTWPEGAVGRERTEAALDSSWALEETVQKWQDSQEAWGDVLLGQMEACFIMVLTLANHSCLEEWKRCAGLVLACQRAIRERETFFVSFLMLLDRQMQRCEDVEGGLFDMAGGADLLEKWLKGFKKKLEQVYGDHEGNGVKEAMAELESTLQKMYGWNLGQPFVKRGTLELEDGETVEMDVGGSEGEDESGEYAPVVVELETG